MSQEEFFLTWISQIPASLWLDIESQKGSVSSPLKYVNKGVYTAYLEYLIQVLYTLNRDGF